MAIQATGFTPAYIQVSLGLTYGNPAKCFVSMVPGGVVQISRLLVYSTLAISNYESELYSPRKSYLYLLDQTRCLILGMCPRASFCLPSKQYHTMLHSNLAYPLKAFPNYEEYQFEK